MIALLLSWGSAGCAGTPSAISSIVAPVDDDNDGDGVTDPLDLCPLTRPGLVVDQRGCALDSDRDRVPDELDQCPKTLPGTWVDSRGCPWKSDTGA